MDYIFQDNWVIYAGGRQHNQPTRIIGTVVEEWYDAPYDYKQLDDGRIFKRHDCYWDKSPYGWNEEIKS